MASDAQIWACTNAEYHSHPAISSSMLNVFLDPLKGPAEYKARYIDKRIPDEPSKDLILGQQIHALLCDNQTLIPIPDSALSATGRRQGKAWDAFKAANPKARWMLKADEIESIQRMADAVAECPLAWAALMQPGRVAEQTVRWTDEETGLKLQCRTDVIDSTPGLITDLKSTKDPHPESFAKSAYNFGYHRQQAFYQTGLYELRGEWMPFVFVAVAKEPPYRVEVIKLDPTFAKLGYEEFRAGLAELKRCIESNAWRPSTWNKLQTIHAPRWAHREPHIQETDE